MKASRIHYFYAQDWPARIWLASFCIGFAIVAAYLCWPLVTSLSVWWHPLILLIIGCIFVAAALGLYVGTIVGWPVIGPLYFDRSLNNGEPFQEGDMVQILVGPHRNRVVRVAKEFDYGDYAGGHRIIVELGDDVPDDECKFRSIQILRVRTAPSKVAEG